MKRAIEAWERAMEWGGAKKDIALLVVSGIALILSMTDALPLPFDAAWVAIVLCGVPIVMEAMIGLVTSFLRKAACFQGLQPIISV